MRRNRIVRIDNLAHEVVLDDPPPNCVALQMAPQSMEESLRTGVWLVLMVAVWSGPDIEQIDRAMRHAMRSPHLMVGVRPFDSPDETSTWLPTVPVTQQSPLWIVLDDGEIRRALIGLPTDEEIANAIE